MKLINASNLYLFILKNLDENEKVHPEGNFSVLYAKFYYNNYDLSMYEIVKRPSIAEFLLSNLLDNWGKMITIFQLEEWMSYAAIPKNMRKHLSRYKYLELIEVLKKRE